MLAELIREIVWNNIASVFQSTLFFQYIKQKLVFLFFVEGENMSVGKSWVSLVLQIHVDLDTLQGWVILKEDSPCTEFFKLRIGMWC